MVLISSMVALVSKWKPAWVFFGSVGLAIVAFIPACTGIMTWLDAQRFGVFQYATYADVRDLRVELYLPDFAHTITLEKTAMGHRAKYTLTEAELQNFLDRLWETGGESSAIDRADLNDGAIASREEMEQWFSDLGWPPLKDAFQFHSPVQADGGGAEYYFEPSTGTTYHRAGYW